MSIEDRILEDFRRISDPDDPRVIGRRAVYNHWMRSNKNFETGATNEEYYQNNINVLRAKRPAMEKVVLESIMPYDSLVFYFEMPELDNVQEPTTKDYIIYKDKRYDVKGIDQQNDENVYSILTQRIRKNSNG